MCGRRDHFERCHIDIKLGEDGPGSQPFLIITDSAEIGDVMSGAAQIDRDIDRIAANQRAVDGWQIAVDAIVTDRGYPGGHKEALKHDEFAFARSTLTLRRDPGLEPGEPRRVCCSSITLS